MQVVTGRARKITKKYIPGGPGDRAAKVGGRPKPSRPFASGTAAFARPLRRRGKRAGGAFFLPEEKKKPKQSELCFGLCQDVTNDKNSLRCHCSLHYIHDYTEKSVGFV